MNHNYCTILSRDSLYQGIVLYNSLVKYDKNFNWFVLCLHEEVFDILMKMKLENTILIPLQELENYDRELLAVKEDRNHKEYAWTIKSPMLLYIFDKYLSTDHLIYIDGDTEFFSKPTAIFKEIKNSSIVLTRERFYIQDNEYWYREYGQYNGGFMAFKRDKNALSALRWLRERCLEWCYNRLENNLYGDQKYTIDWTDRFPSVNVPTNLGINVTAWYAHACDLESIEEKLYINTEKIIFYHYNGFAIYNDKEFELCIFMKLPQRLISLIYEPYISKLQDVISLVAQYDNSFYSKISKESANQYFNNYYKSNRDVPSTLYSAKKSNYCTLIGKDYLIKGITLYNSLNNTHNSFHLWICCMDDYAFNFLSALELANVTLIPLSSIEDQELLSLKSSRTSSEYCWTIKAHWMIYLFKNFSFLPSLVFVDGDLFFFKEADYVFEQLKGHSILLCPQRDRDWVEEQFGKYQAGFVGAKNDHKALDVLNWWKARCLEWCSEEQGHKDRWGDQKYLDKIPELFDNVKISDHLGVDAALWNTVNNLNITGNDVYVNNHQLLCYHFCNMVIFNEREYDLWKWPNWHVDRQLLEYIYKPYIKGLYDTISYLRSINLDVEQFFDNTSEERLAYNYYKFPASKNS